jgi:MFS family permease
MLASITPLGERGRGNRWTTTAALYIAASLAAGAALGALMGSLGSLLLADVGTSWRLGLLAAALALGVAFELGRGRIPGPRRQVNERWLDEYRRWIYAAGFGAQLGAGVVTIVVSSAVYAVWAAALASASPSAGAAIGAAAGAMRGATLLASARTTTPQRLVALHERLQSIQGPVRRGTIGAQLALVAAAALVLVV